jgi:thioredoxin 1
MKAVLLIIGALAVIGGVGYAVYRQNNEASAPASPASSQPSQPTPQSGSENSASGSYETYEDAKLARAKDGSVVLFFNAVWCPDCRATVRDLEANRDKIPAKLTILSVDYDKYTDLKQKYGVTYQHTFVQVDENGNQLKKWGGSFTLNDIVAQVE